MKGIDAEQRSHGNTNLKTDDFCASRHVFGRRGPTGFTQEEIRAGKSWLVVAMSILFIFHFNCLYKQNSDPSSLTL